MRLIVLSDRMIGGTSAYTQQTYEICTRLKAAGHSVAHIPMGRANNMGRQVYKGVVVYDSGYDSFAEDVAESHYIDFNADVLIANKEPWVFNRIHNSAINLIPMAVIDHAPVSGLMLARLKHPFKVIVISRHGEKELRNHGIKSTYIPLGVETDLFKPLNKAECKKTWFIDDPNDFTVGIVARNQARKMIPQMLLGYKRFLELNPDVKSHLLLWTNVMPQRSELRVLGVSDVGVNLLPEIYALGLGNSVHWPKWEEIEKIGGLPIVPEVGAGAALASEEHKLSVQARMASQTPCMASIYGASDVNLLCSGGEGGGKPYLEAAAMGVPSIYTNYAAAPEYAGPYGVGVNAEDYVIINTPGTRYYLADIDGMAEALTKIYNRGSDERAREAKKLRMWAEKFSWERVIKEYWLPFLEECEAELYPKITKEGLGKWAM